MVACVPIITGIFCQRHVHLTPASKQQSTDHPLVKAPFSCRSPRSLDRNIGGVIVMADQPTPPFAPATRNKGVITPYEGKPTVTSRLIRPSFCGGYVRGGG